MNTSKNKRKEYGLALVAVLWVGVLLGIIVIAAAKTVRLDSRLSRASGEHIRGRWASRAGIEKAISLLNQDSLYSDSLTDIWSENGEDCNDIPLGQCTFSIKIIDEASKLNINTATDKQLQQLPDMTEEIVASIIDWRDSDDNPQRHGAEGSYYLKLDHPYHIRNGHFQTIQELLLVKGMSQELLFGEDANNNGKLDYNECDGDKTSPNDNADNVLDKGWAAFLTCYSYDLNKDSQSQSRININTADQKKLVKSLQLKQSHAKWIVDNRQNNYQSIADLINKDSKKKDDGKEDNPDEAKPLDLQTFAQIADKITITDDEKITGRININTASKRVITALLEGDVKSAEKILNHRNSSGAMISIAELLSIKDFKIDTFKKIANNISTRTNVFSVRTEVVSKVTSAEFQSQAVLDRGGEQVAILYQYQEQ